MARQALVAWAAALLLWVPLPFGSVVPWSHAVLQVATFLLLALAAALVRNHGELRRVGTPAAAIAAVALLGLLQSLQWPHAIVRTLSPEHARLQAQAAAVVAGVEGAPAVASTLSLAPAVSRAAALTWLAVAACLVVAALVGANRAERRILGLTIVASGLFQVFYGAQRLAAREATIWGVEVPGNASRLRGKLFLIVGELDDNVPPESTLRFVDALIKAGREFDLLVIPGAGHGMGGAYGQRRMQDFFVRHLQGTDPPDRNAAASAE